jgi:hypothetical protein
VELAIRFSLERSAGNYLPAAYIEHGVIGLFGAQSQLLLTLSAGRSLGAIVRLWWRRKAPPMLVTNLSTGSWMLMLFDLGAGEEHLTPSRGG